MQKDSSITRREIINHLSGNTAKAEVDAGVEYVISKLGLNLTDYADDSLTKLRGCVSGIRTRYNDKWQLARRTKSRFENANAAWMDEVVNVTELLTPKTVSSSSSDASDAEPGTSTPLPRGRPSLPFSEQSQRTRRSSATQLSHAIAGTPTKMVMAAAYTARSQGNTDLASILQIALRSPRTISKARRTLFAEPKQPIMYTAADALFLLLEHSLSKAQYLAISKGARERGVDLYPGYNRVVKEKQNCRPPREEIFIDEFKGEVLLQTLLNHTGNRIVALQQEVVKQYMTTSEVTNVQLILLSSWGMDGSGGHSMYQQKQASASAKNEETNLFAITTIPLRLYVSSSPTSILWNNPTPQSPRFCRPIKLQFIKETEELVKEEHIRIMNEIRSLEPLHVEFDGGLSVDVKFVMFLTSIDGKVLNYITDTKSTQSCPICHATPKDFNYLSNIDTRVFHPHPDSLQYGISPLHAWIRFLECCLHVSYRLVFNPPVWRVPGGQNNPVLKKRKYEVQERIKNEMHLKVDVVKPGYGTTNDGNTSRRAFRQSNLFATILGLNPQLIKNFQVILITLSCQLPVDPVLFGSFCRDTAKIYVENYPWYPMPPTIHKVLIHGSEIITSSVLPVGMLGEDGAESRNKYYRKFRLDHARKTSRKDNMEDVFLRSMDTSDPILSSIDLSMRLSKRKRLKLPIEVINMLAITETDEVEVEEDHVEDDPEEMSCESEDLSVLEELFHYLDATVMVNQEHEQELD